MTAPLKRHIKAPVEHLVTVLSESAGFQSVVSAADATEALASIHVQYAEDSDGDTSAQSAKPYPRAIVSLTSLGSTKRGTWRVSGEYSILIERYPPDTDRDKSLGGMALSWLGDIETIYDDIKELVMDRSKLMADSLSLSVPPMMDIPEKDTRQRKRLWVAQMAIGVNT